MAEKEQFPTDVFTSLQELLKKEHSSQYFAYRSSRKKVNTILSGKHNSKLRGRGLDFEEARTYVKGDDIRNIDWKITARMQKPYTRVYTEEKEKPVLLVVDQSKSMFFGSQKRTKSVVAAEVGASIAFKVLKEGDRVGGIVFADNGIDVIKPKRDRKNTLHFLKKLEQRNRELKTSEPVAFKDALAETVMRIRNIATHDYLVVLISDFNRNSADVAKAIAQTAAHNDVILIKISDPLELKLPKEQFVIGNRTHQIYLNGHQGSYIEDYNDKVNNDFLLFEKKMNNYGVSVLKMNTVDDVDDQLKKVF